MDDTNKIRKIIKTTLNEFLNETYKTTYDKEFKSFKEWAYEYAKDNAQGFNNVDDAIEYLNWFFEVYENVPQEMTLYRILYLEKKSDLNRKIIGLHFTDNNKNFDNGFLQNLGFSRSEIDSSKFYIITINVNRNDIDWENTVATRLQHPYEDEYTLKRTAKYKISSIEKWEENF
jgi:hypothetical protein